MICGRLISNFFNITEYKAHAITAINIHRSPGVKLRYIRLFTSPFKTMQDTPIIDKIIPKNWKKFVLFLKIINEKNKINSGAIDPINDALITKVLCIAIYVKELKMATLRTDKKIIIFKFFLIKKIFLKIDL